MVSLLLAAVEASLLLAAADLAAHPHPRFQGEVWRPHVHGVVPRQAGTPFWRSVLVVAVMLLVFVALPWGIYLAASKAWMRLRKRWDR